MRGGGWGGGTRFTHFWGTRRPGVNPLLGHHGDSARAGAATSPKRHLYPYRPQFHRHGVLRSRQLRRTVAERAQPRVDARGIAKRSGRRKNLFPELVLNPTAGETVRRSVSMATIGSQSPRRSIGVKRALLCPPGWTERLLAGAATVALFAAATCRRGHGYSPKTVMS